MTTAAPNNRSSLFIILTPSIVYCAQRIDKSLFACYNESTNQSSESLMNVYDGNEKYITWDMLIPIPADVAKDAVIVANVEEK